MNSAENAITERPPAVLAHESQESYAQLAARLRAELAPEDEHQSFLVDRMIHARWSHSRYERLLSQAFEAVLAEPDTDPNPDFKILNTLLQRSNIIDKLERRLRETAMDYDRAHRELRAARKAAVKPQPEVAAQAEQTDPHDEPAEAVTADAVCAMPQAPPSCYDNLPPRYVDNPALRL